MAAFSPEWMKRVETALTCSGCSKILQDPRVANCGHTLCYRCLTSFSAQPKFAFAKSTRPAPGVQLPTTVHCQQCSTTGRGAVYQGYFINGVLNAACTEYISCLKQSKASGITADLSSKWMRWVEEQLICAYCKKLLSNPVAISCGHTVCQGCIRVTGNNAYFGQQVVNNTFSNCPSCNIQITTTVVNVVLMELCRIYTLCKHDQDSQDKMEESTSNCVCHPDKEVTKVCMTCQDKFCDDCSRLGNLCSHPILPIDGAITSIKAKYNKIKQSLLVLHKRIADKSRSTNKYINHLQKTEEVIKETSVELKRILSTLVENVMQRHSKDMEKRLWGSNICLDALAQIENKVKELCSGLDWQVTPDNFMHKDSSFPNLDQEAKLLLQEFAMYKADVNTDERLKVKLQYSLTKGMEGLLTQCCSVTDVEQYTGIQSKQVTEYLQLVDTKNPTVSRQLQMSPELDVKHCQSPDICDIAPINSDTFMAIYNYNCIVKLDAKDGLCSTIFKCPLGIKIKSLAVCEIGGKTCLTMTKNASGKMRIYVIGTERLLQGQNLQELDQVLGEGDDGNWTPQKVCIWSLKQQRSVKEIQLNTGFVSAFLCSYYHDIIAYVLDDNGNLGGVSLYSNSTIPAITGNNTSLCQSIDRIACDGKGNLWVMDVMGRKLVCFDSDGKPRYVLSTNVASLKTMIGFHIREERIFVWAKGGQTYKKVSIALPSD